MVGCAITGEEDGVAQAPPVVGESEEDGVAQAPPAVGESEEDGVAPAVGKSEEDGVAQAPLAVGVAEGVEHATFGVMLGVGAGVSVSNSCVVVLLSSSPLS